MKLLRSQVGAAAIAVLMTFGAPTLSRAATIQPFAGDSLSVTETFANGALEFTINNPANSSLGDIFGMMIGISNQNLVTGSQNGGWDHGILTSDAALRDFFDNVGFGLSSLEGVFGLADEFVNFFNPGDGDDVILFYFSIDSSNEPLDPVPPGFSLGGFFGLNATSFGSEVLLFGAEFEFGLVETTVADSVPEPSMFVLFGIGVIGIAVAARRGITRSYAPRLTARS
jgi:hypothetical protein